MVKTIQQIDAVMALKKNVNVPADHRFLELLKLDERLLRDKELFAQVSRMYFGPSFGEYLAGYVFD